MDEEKKESSREPKRENIYVTETRMKEKKRKRERKSEKIGEKDCERRTENRRSRVGQRYGMQNLDEGRDQDAHDD